MFDVLARMAVILPFLCAIAHGMDLRTAVVVAPVSASVPVRKASQMLREEVEKRTQIRLVETHALPRAEQPAILIGVNGQLQELAANLFRQLPAVPRGGEGFRVAVVGRPVIVAGHSDRAVV